MRIGPVIVRVLLGGLFIGHGTQKLFGWFGGEGPRGTGETFAKAGLRPGRANAVAAGAAETAGGSLLVLGLATPVAAATLSSVMLTAIRTVHWRNGPWVTRGGYEYPTVVLATLLALTEAGPGRLSLDAARGRTRAGSAWAVAELAVAALASHVVIGRGRRASTGVTSSERHDTEDESFLRAA